MKGFFHNISWAQIFAGALAAVTAFLLSAKIGIAGSVIGVAVGSIVSTVTTQIYQRVLNESGKKIQKTVVSVHYNPNRSDDGGDEDGGAGNDGAGNDGSDAEDTRVISSADETTRSDDRKQGGTSEQNAGMTAELPATMATPKADSSALDATSRFSAVGPVSAGDSSGRKIVGEADASSKTGAAGSSDSSFTKKIESSAHAGKASKAKVSHLDSRRRKVLIVAIVSAVLAFGGTAGIIYAVTNGQGTDQVVRNIVSPSKTAAPSPSVSTSTESDTQPTRSDKKTGQTEPSQTTNSSDSDDSDQSTSTPSSSSTQTSGSTSTPSTSSSSSSSSSSTATSTSSASPSASASTSSAQPEAASTSSTD
ncbi:MAG: hypothetical protein ABF747_07125 [Bifidobacterium sp.]|uniref:ABC transporter permease n=1 Tax=Bifidobacterium fermentum TaxID=3059035 RepID=A0AB39U9J6_9BIFI